MSRNLVMCFDGSGGQVRARANSNVVLTYELLDLTDPARQVGYYDPGVGTMAAAGAWSPPVRWLSRLAGLAFGSGLRQNLGDAYAWLMRVWAPGDRIFLFGFSRGAYTARALSGLLRTVGVLRPGSDNLIPYAVSAYARPVGEQTFDFKDLYQLAHAFGQRHGGHTAVHVDYLGVWDTVNSVGLLRLQATWPYTNKLPYVQRLCHAVSIDEWRRPFTPALVTAAGDPQREEAWFASIHADLGGTFLDDAGLSTISLKWVLDGAIEQGLLVPPAAYAAACTVTEATATATLHRNGPWWALLGTRRRQIPAGASLHSSVQVRRARDPSYQPRLPPAVTWVDPEWTTAAGQA